MNDEQAKAAWLAARRQHLTSTDSPAILGESRFASALNVFTRKLGLEPEPEANERMELGSALQAPVAELFGRRTGRAIAHVDPYLLVRHAEITFLATSLDAFQEVQGKGRGLVEVKLSEKEWGDEPPLGYQIQLQHALLVTGAKWGSVVCLVRGAQLVFFDYEANTEFQGTLVRVLTDFWNECLCKQEPPAQGWEHPEAKAALRALYPEDNGEAVELPDDALRIASEWDEIDAQLARANADVKALSAQREALSNRLKLMMKTAQIAVLPDGTGFRWHSYPVKGYEVEPSVRRQFNRLSPGALSKHLKKR